MLLRTFLLAVSSGLFLGAAVQAATVDTIDATSAAANTPGGNHFAPDAGETYNSPYYRWNGQDWGWTHNAIASGFSTASLNISAYDVDAAAGERDSISVFNNDTLAWDLLGYLSGYDNAYGYTAFDLASSYYDEIAAGLQVRIGVDVDNAGWAVTLAKSVLTTDGAAPPPPDPGMAPVPLPAAAPLLLVGLGALGMIRRRKRT